MQKLLLVAVALVLSLSACYYDNEEELYPTAAGGGGCDTANVTYSGVISKIVGTRCALAGCHAGASSQAIGNFENYTSLKTFLDGQKGTFINAINHNAGTSPMPKGSAKLSGCNISQIQIWINNGYPNN